MDVFKLLGRSRERQRRAEKTPYVESALPQRGAVLFFCQTSNAAGGHGFVAENSGNSPVTLSVWYRT